MGRGSGRGPHHRGETSTTLPATVTITGSWLTPDQKPATGVVLITPVAPATGGGYIVVAKQITATLVGGAISVVVTNNTNVPTLQYQIVEQVTGTPVDSYIVSPTGSTLNLSTAPRNVPAVSTYVLASTVGQANGVASLDDTGNVPASQLGNALLPASVGTVGGPAGPLNALGQLPPGQLNVTAARAAQLGLIGMTEDLGIVPSQSGVTPGRLFVYPFVAGLSDTVYYAIAAYESATAGNTNTDSFIGVYNEAGTELLGVTSDLASQLTTTGGARVIGTMETPFALTAGVAYNLALLNNYTTTGPQWMCTRLYGTNWGSGTGIINRVLVNASGSTMTSLPASLPTMQASGTNSLVAIGLAQGP